VKPIAVTGPGEVACAALAASLPMYDLPEVRQATDALWFAISARLAARGVDAPASLARDAGALEALWSSPGLLLSQTCGYPLMTHLQGLVDVLGAPSYGAAGCEGPFHRSAIVVSKSAGASVLGDLRGRRCAINQPDSNTGMNLLRAEVAKLAAGAPFFSAVMVTGSHASSLEFIASGRADVAAIDAVSYALLQRWRPALTSEVRVLTWTRPSPGLPLITGKSRPPHTLATLREVLTEVAADSALRDVRRELLWEGFAPLSMADYAPVLASARQAAELEYPELA
jgi:ABC-type phosphate/phosphonate transport system substrate-binding protein